MYHKLVTGLAIPGWASMTIVASLFGALNSLGIAVLGEYVIRIYDQVRQRPPFVIASKINFDGTASESLEKKILSTIDELQGSVEQQPTHVPLTVPMGTGQVQQQSESI